MPKLSLSSAKWLGKDAVVALAVDGKGTKAELLEKVARWVAANGRNVTQPGMLRISWIIVLLDSLLLVMIVSYETLRILTVHLANCTIGLLLCDEGHRLKNSGESSSFHRSMINFDKICDRIVDISSPERIKRQAASYSFWYTHPGELN